MYIQDFQRATKKSSKLCFIEFIYNIDYNDKSNYLDMLCNPKIKDISFEYLNKMATKFPPKLCYKKKYLGSLRF